jgi:uncharacterized protein YbjT (DUF2867 family)
MNLAVFKASGGIGSHIIALAAQRDHHVRAAYRAAPGILGLEWLIAASMGIGRLRRGKRHTPARRRLATD